MSLPYPLLPQNTLQIGPQGPLGIGTSALPARGSAYGEQIIQQLNGKYHELVINGQVFSAKVGGTQAQVVPCYATLTNAFCILNRSSSNRLVVPLFLNMSMAGNFATSTGAINNLSFGIALLNGAGDGVATGLPVASGTLLTPTNMLFGSPVGAYTQFFATDAFTASTAAVVQYELGAGFLQGIGATSTAGAGTLWNLQHDFHGVMALKPGTAMAVVVSNVITGGSVSATYNQNLIFAEMQLPSWVN